MKTTRLIAGVIGVVVVTAACGSEPEPEPESPERSSNPRAQWVELRDAYLVPESCSDTANRNAMLTFVVQNNRVEGTERLTEITSPAADAVVFEPAEPIELAPFASNSVGLPGSNPRPYVTSTVRGLHTPPRPDGAVPLIFHFDQAGLVEKMVPVEPCGS